MKNEVLLSDIEILRILEWHKIFKKNQKTVEKNKMTGFYNKMDKEICSMLKIVLIDNNN